MLFKAPDPHSPAAASAQHLSRISAGIGVDPGIPAPVHARGGGLRLLIVNYEFPPVGGGASFACLGLARTLVARGNRVDVLTSRLQRQPRFEEIEGIRVHRVRSWRHGYHECGLRGAATFLFFAFLRLRRLIASERYNLVHYFFGLPSGVLSLYT